VRVIFTQSLFEDARLYRVSFMGATLDRALLRTQFTDGAIFTGASLVNADMRGMGGTGVDFADADLSGVDLDDSFFHFSDFRNVIFAGADLGEFTAEDSDFRGADLSSAVNIDSLFPRSVYDSSTQLSPGIRPTRRRDDICAGTRYCQFAIGGPGFFRFPTRKIAAQMSLESLDAIFTQMER
jgi:hypothetical protein